MPRRRYFWVVVVTLFTLGSGLVDLYSVANPNVSRDATLRHIFPLEVIRFSRTVVLLAGFALVVTSVNLYRRKRRAFWVASVLTAFSVIFHLTKGLDYEEAIFSLVLLAVLFISRDTFTVGSGLPDLRSGVAKLVLAVALVFAYGVAGFWFLEPRDFGVNFNWKDSIDRTFELLTLHEDPSLVPRTHFALWFLRSFYVLAITGAVYGGFAFFQPVIYRYRTLPRERHAAEAIARRYARASLSYFTLWPDKSYFFNSQRTAYVAYAVSGNFAVALGDPIGPEDTIKSTAQGFAGWCEDNGWIFCFHQVLPDFLEMYRRIGLKRLKVGDEAIVDLRSFTLEGKPMKEFRSKIRTLEAAGVHTRLFDPPVPEALLDELREVSDEWLNIPGRRERSFTLGSFDPDYLRSTAVFVVKGTDGRVLAFANLLPSFRTGETAIDLMRRRNTAPNGVMDYLFVKLFLLQKERGFDRFNLGLAPLSGFQEREIASPQERAVHQFLQKLNFIFSFKGLKAYKAKFASSWEPRYVVYRNVLELARFPLALRGVSELRNHEDR